MFKINKNKKHYSIAFISIALTLSAISCSTSNIENINNSQKINIFKISKNNSGEINFKLTPNASLILERGVGNTRDHFSIKYNANGKFGGTTPQIDHYVAYLVKNASTTGYPAGGDPLNATDLVAGPFTIVNDGSTLVKLTGVNALSSGAYYVAILAQDSSNNNLIKVNNGSGTAWGTTTTSAPYNGKLAVSSGAGITVNSTTYAVNTTTPLSVIL